MCGIVGAVAERNVVPVLMEGLRRLEYRGYDSAGVAALNGGRIDRRRRLGKVAELQAALDKNPISSVIGIAHTRWATHGAPSEANAHPHMSGDDLAIVHNGIIENYEALRDDLRSKGYEFHTETDSEVVAHLIHHYLGEGADLFDAVRSTVDVLEGAYALVVISQDQPDRMVLARLAMPVVIGLGIEENFVASDVAALLPVTRRFIFLEEGDVAEVRKHSVRIVDGDGNEVERTISESSQSADAADKGSYRHYMLKEIHEQPEGVAQTLEGRISNGHLLDAAFGPESGRDIRRDQCGADHRMRHELSCGRRHPVPGRGNLRPAMQRRNRERVPLSEPGRHAGHVVCHDFAVRGNGRHAGGAEDGEGSRLSRNAGDL